MYITSLGYRTDLFFSKFEGEIHNREYETIGFQPSERQVGLEWWEEAKA